jgi:hypothetical protein
MKGKLYIGTVVSLLLLAALFHDKAWIMAGILFLAMALLSLWTLTSGIEYSESHYRVYKQLFFWRTGHWKSISGVRRIYIRHFLQKQKKSRPQNHTIQEAERDSNVKFQVYFVRKSGYYKIFESDTLDAARKKAKALSYRYNLTIEEKGNEKQEQQVEQQHKHAELLMQG